MSSQLCFRNNLSVYSVYVWLFVYGSMYDKLYICSMYIHKFVTLF